MRIHNWFEGLLDSKSKIRILRLITKYPEREFTEREIAEFIGMSPNTVNLALKDICKTNVLSLKKIGRANAYRCNKSSALFEHLKNIFENESKVKKQLIEIIRKNMCNTISCIMFGSFAERKEKFDSDLDLLIIAEEKSEIEGALKKLEVEISKRFSTALSPMVYTTQELKRIRNKAFIKKILKNGVVICGKTLEEVYAKGN